MSGITGQKFFIRYSRKSRNPVSILIVFLLLVTSAHAADETRIKISEAGETIILDRAVKVIIQTHTVDVGTESAPKILSPETSCTYSRIPCSVVDKIKIFTHSKEVYVPRSIYADLADLDSCNLASNKGKTVLNCEAGDASDSYDKK